MINLISTGITFRKKAPYLRKGPILCAALILLMGTSQCTSGQKKNYRALFTQILERNKKNNAAGCTGGCLLFVGDSNVEILNWQHYFQVKVCNYGFRGSTTDSLLKRKTRVKNLKPGTIVMLVGGNDLLKHQGLRYINANYYRLIRYYLRITPRVYCISNLPVNNTIYVKNSTMIKLNSLLEKTSRRLGARYINVFPALYTKKFGLNPRYALDFVHLNRAGHDVLVPQVRARVAPR